MEERNQRTENEPGALFREQRNAAQYLNHPYGTPVIGWRHEMEGLTLEDAMAFYRAHYAPNNAILVVAGDVTEAEVRRLAEKHYGPSRPTPPRAARPPAGAAAAGRTAADLRRPARGAALRPPHLPRPRTRRGRPARGGGASPAGRGAGRLAQTSVLAREAPVRHAGLGLLGLLQRHVPRRHDLRHGRRPGRGRVAAGGEDALDRALAEFLEEGIDDDQLERIRTQIRAGLIYEEDDIQSLARSYGMALTSGLTVADIEAWPEILKSVTEEEIVAARSRRRHAVASFSARPPTP